MASLVLKPSTIIEASIAEELWPSSQFLKQTWSNGSLLEFDALAQTRQYLFQTPINNTFLVR